jgi:hypothetical protein
LCKVSRSKVGVIQSQEMQATHLTTSLDARVWVVVDDGRGGDGEAVTYMFLKNARDHLTKRHLNPAGGAVEGHLDGNHGVRAICIRSCRHDGRRGCLFAGVLAKVGLRVEACNH